LFVFGAAENFGANARWPSSEELRKTSFKVGEMGFSELHEMKLHDAKNRVMAQRMPPRIVFSKIASLDGFLESRIGIFAGLNYIVGKTETTMGNRQRCERRPPARFEGHRNR